MADKESEVSIAFKRAVELRDAPIRQAIVRGAKDGAKRLVEVLWGDIQPNEDGPKYRRCIMPLNDTEAAAIRKTSPTYYIDRLAKPPVAKVALPVTCHQLLIRADRLEFV